MNTSSSLPGETHAPGAQEDAPVRVKARCKPEGRFSYLRLKRDHTPMDGGFGRDGEFGHERFPLDRIKAWAAKGGNLGVRTGKQSMCFVLEFDPRNGGDETLARLTEEHGDLPETFTVASGRGDGGKHYYFRLPDFEVSSGANVLGPGIDIKGEASYVVAAGSVHKATGGRYKVVCAAPIAQPPEWLVAFLRKRAGATAQRAAERRSAASQAVEKVDVPDECCQRRSDRAVARLDKAEDALTAADPQERIEVGLHAPVGWDSGFYLLAARRIEIARWPYTSYSMEDAERDFFAHAPGRSTDFNPEHAWEQGLANAGEDWTRGYQHRKDKHFEEDYPVSVLLRENGEPIRSRATDEQVARAKARIEREQRGEPEPSLSPEDQFEAEVADTVRRLKVVEEAKRRHAEDKSDPADWEPVDLGPALRDGPVLPDVGHRTDGVGVFYSEKLNVVYGESEGGKTWVALHAAVQVMAADEPCDVVFLDYEDSDRSIAQRLVSLNVPEDMILDRFHYVNPPGPFTDRAFDRLKALLSRARLVVIDATTEALAVEGLDSNSDTDIAEFYNRYPKRIAALGPAVVVIDHVTKAVDGRGQQIGSQMKKAGVDGVAYNVEPLTPFKRGAGGSSMVLIGKDKQGGVREHGVFGGEGRQERFGVFQLDAQGCARLSTVKPAETKEERELKKSGELLDAIREFLAEHPDASARKTIDALRAQGLKVDDKKARAWIREVKEESE